MNKVKKYKAAIVGLGNIAFNFDKNSELNNFKFPLTHAMSYIHHPQVTIISGCDPSLESRLSFQEKFNVPTFPDIFSMLEATQPNILSICSPTPSHFEQVKIALKNNDIQMIWLEKPPTLNLDEHLALIELNSKLKKTIVVNFMRRYSPLYENIRNIIDNKTYGLVKGIQVKYSRGLLNNGSHLIDILNYLLGDQLLNSYHFYYVDKINQSAIINFKNLFYIHLINHEINYHSLDLEVTFENARLSALYGGRTLKTELKVENDLFPGFFHLQPFSEENLPSHHNTSFFNCVLTDLIFSFENKKLPRSNLETALFTSQFIDKFN
jgi:myo-inositol 2-dehydrogenase/D-chiro-inositol 1-dehydrogenase